ncbi:hypothetical protein Vi05172_g5472 [Venturia inaequalis]|nr:hypothetical protein Vi05172_g5472 [Venturia inaequalis]
MPDSRVAGVSIGGIGQFEALQAIIDVKLDLTRAGEQQIRFGKGDLVNSLGIADVPT